MSDAATNAVTRVWQCIPTRDPTRGMFVASLFNQRNETVEFDLQLPTQVKLAVALRPQYGKIWSDQRLCHQGDIPIGGINIVPHGERSSGFATGETMLFALPIDLIDSILEHESVRPERVEFLFPGFQQDRTLLNLAMRMKVELQSESILSRFAVDVIAQNMILHLLREHSSLGAKSRTVKNLSRHTGGLARWQIRRACAAMEAHLDAEISLRMLAHEAGCSPTHFSRAFKQSTGIAPFAWLSNQRIELAKRLLLKPELPLVEIALQVGFAAQPQFTTAFKRHTGMTPGAWRRSQL